MLFISVMGGVVVSVGVFYWVGGLRGCFVVPNGKLWYTFGFGDIRLSIRLVCCPFRRPCSFCCRICHFLQNEPIFFQDRFYSFFVYVFPTV